MSRHSTKISVSPCVLGLLRSRQTTGQAVHALRRNDCSDKHPKVTLLDGTVNPSCYLIQPYICISVHCKLSLYMFQCYFGASHNHLSYDSN